MEYYAYTLYEDVKDFFNAEQLLIVAWANKSSITGNWNMHRNKTPATKYFHRANVLPISDTMFQLTRRSYDRSTGKIIDKPYALMEKTEEGGAWRYYNKPTIEDATQRLVMVEGAFDRDLYYANPGMRITDQDNGISLIENITILNGVPYTEVQNNVDIQGIGCMWYMRGVEDLNYVQGGYIANGNTVDLNRGSGRLDFCKLTERTDVPISQDVKGDSDKYTEVADYVYTEEDRIDPEREYLSLTIYHGVKRTISPLTLPVETILPKPVKK